MSLKPEAFSLHLFKQNFKYSAAHFLIFDAERAERLHGHNYRVRLDMRVARPSDPPGYSVDFSKIKKRVLETVELWDERVLLPGRHPEMRLRETSKGLEVHFRDRYYVFPVSEVVVLPIYNTSVEAMARLLGQTLAPTLQELGILEFRLRVEETAGQAASCHFRDSSERSEA